MELEVAYSSKVISPPIGVELGGYGFYRNRKNKGIHDDLYVRALLLRAKDEAILVYNADLLEISERIVNEVECKVSKRLGLHEDKIILTVTHTHSAPPTTRLRGLGEVNEDYVNFLIDSFLEVIESLEKNVVRTNVFFSQANLKGVAFNRVTKGEPIDSTVRVIQFKKLTKEVAITLFNYSCHPVTIDVRTDAGLYVSADWPGVSMRFINKRLGGISVFLQGTCGDIDPVVAWKMRGFDASKEIGLRVAKAVINAINRSVKVKEHGLRVVSKSISLPLQQISHEDLIKIISIHLKRLESMKPDITMDMSNILALVRFYRESMNELCEKISKGLPKYIKRKIYLIKIGEVALLFIPGEVFMEVGLKIKELSHIKKLLIVGYTGAYAGYIPTLEEFDRYGYAAYMVPLMLGWPPYNRNIAQILIKECVSLLSHAS